MKNNFLIKDKWFYIPILIFLGIFIMSFINYLPISYSYPFHAGTDLSTYLTRLSFLAEYGFHEFVPNIYEGIILFQHYPIGWAYFALPFYLITDNLLLSAFITLILSFILMGLFVYFISKRENFSLVRYLAFLAILIGNPLSINLFFHIGSNSETFGWTLFLVNFFILLYYKDRRIDKKFLIFILSYAALLLTHIYPFVLLSVLILGLFLVKSKKGKLIIASCAGISLLLTSFWWIPFSTITKNGGVFWWSIANEIQGTSFLELFFSYNTLSLILLFGSFYLFWRSISYSKRELKFYLPVLILGILVASRLIVFIPIINQIPFNLYTQLFIFIAVFLFLKIKNYNLNWVIIQKLLAVLLILFSIGSFIFIFYYYNDGSLSYKGSYTYTDTDKDVISLISDIDNKFFIVGDQPYGTNLRYAAYGVIFYNLTTSMGSHTPSAINQTIINSIKEIETDYEIRNCELLINHLNSLKIKNLLSYEGGCDFLADCNLKILRENDNACLFGIN